MKHPIEDCVVRISLGSDNRVNGSGFLIERRTICTCAHVLFKPRDASPVKINTINFPFLDHDNRIEATVSSWVNPSPNGGDIAFLSIGENVGECRSLLPTGSLTGTPFEVYGFPSGYADGVWATGVIGNKDARGWYELSAERQEGFAVKGGFSGAPVWDKVRLGIVGMIVAVDNDPTTRVGFMIPTETCARAYPGHLPIRNGDSIGLINGESIETWLWGAKRLPTPDPVAAYLGNNLSTRVDVAEKYWIYIALGKMGGKVAESILHRASKEERDRYALLGLSEALLNLSP
jgi:hypothetical protein